MKYRNAVLALVFVSSFRSNLCWSIESSPRIRLVPFLGYLDFPVHVTHDGSDRLYVVEQRGRIGIVLNGKLQSKPFLDIKDRVRFGGECGLLCVAFHPHFVENRRFFVNYTTQRDGLHTIISEFVANPDGVSAPASSERIIMKFKQPWSNHNGGQILFGPDGKFYIGVGDGGMGGDPLDSGQRLNTILGKILRIDVDSAKPYGIPPDNPFAGRAEIRPEIWAYGMRNPWRFSFDPVTRLLYAADVGQNKWEEIHIVEKGGNHGWNQFEGKHRFNIERVSNERFISPIKEYGRDWGVSITGGHVYRGKRYPRLAGYYLYADFETGRIAALRYENGHLVEDIELIQAPFRISSFGEDINGELFVCDHDNGRVLRVAVE